MPLSARRARAKMEAIALRPLESLDALPPHLDGSRGVNRQARAPLRNDLEAIRFWLQRVAHAPHTFRVYRKEIERLLLWCLIVRDHALSDLPMTAIPDYQQFLKDPQPTERWCGPRRLRNDAAWRPFEHGLAARSRNHAWVILQNAFNFFVSCGYWQQNPAQFVPHHDVANTVHAEDSVERYLDVVTWKYFWRYIHQGCYLFQKNTNQNRQHLSIQREKIYQRNLFLFTLLYLQAPRVSEVANGKMGDFFQLRGRWWWKITGKGRKTAKIPLHDLTIAALRKYREFFGYPAPLPLVDENTPLICHLNAVEKGVCADTIWRTVHEIAVLAADFCAVQEPQRAALLRQVSTHWMRHTSLTHQAEHGVDIRYLQAIARHASIETTQRYLHLEEDRWYAEFHKHQLPLED